MNYSKNSVQARIKNLSAKTGASANVLLATYFFEAFLYRLSKSDYAENFIFKGGFYLSSVIGVQNRYTQDLDFKLAGEELEEENLVKIINDIISKNADDNISFDFSSIESIRGEDQYGGFTVSIIGHLENIRQTVNIDIATGDPITPSSITYSYKRLIAEDILNFKAYNLETILAEKLQTIYSRGLFNSRSKDFYDVYIIHKLKMGEINCENLKEAFAKTCGYRETNFSKEDVNILLKELETHIQTLNRWKNYARKNSFAKNISFETVIESCKFMTNIVFE